jgi:hypothetical protein
MRRRRAARRIEVDVTPGSVDPRVGPANAAVTPVAKVRTSADSANAIFLLIEDGLLAVGSRAMRARW